MKEHIETLKSMLLCAHDCSHAIRFAIERLSNQERIAAQRVWKGKLHHDKNPHADWGNIRDETGTLIYVARAPLEVVLDENKLNEHRKDGTDPAQARVDALLQAFGYEAEDRTDGGCTPPDEALGKGEA